MANCPLSTALSWYAQGKKVAVATVIKTWGSAPRPMGSQLFIHENGSFEGSVSGGCIEGAVIEEALSQLDSGDTKILDFGVSNEMAWEVGLSCGGEIKVLVTPMTEQSYKSYCEYLKAGENRQQGYLCHYLTSPNVEFTSSNTMPSTNSDQTFLISALPPIRFIIIGAVHIAKHLAKMASGMEFKVQVIDPREAFTNSFDVNKEAIKVHNDWPDDVLGGVLGDVLSQEINNSPSTFDGRTALVTLTHDPKLDDPAIKLALKNDAGYIGCLGSKKTHAARLERLLNEGFNQSDIDTIHGPIGLSIGAKGAAEIAVSILAEVIQHFRQMQNAGNKK
jgi:xanthine dehydrogenase accessory factor